MAPQIEQTGLVIPEEEDWPVQGRDPETGGLIIREGFVETLERANGLEIGTLNEDDVRGLLVIWYLDRREAGEPADSVMDALVHEELRALSDETGGEDPGRR